MFSQEQALIAGGATAAQIAAWHQQNAAQFAALKQQSEALAALLNQQPMAAPPPVTIPANATPEMQEFLQNRATLAASLAQLHNQAAGSGFVPATGTPGTATGAPAVVTVGQQWEQQNAALLQRQQQLAGILAQQAAQQPVTLPPPLIIPANASPQLQAYLTLRDQLARDQMNLQSQYATADPATRQAALSQWQKNNASRFQQLQQLAQALTPTTQTTSGSSP